MKKIVFIGAITSALYAAPVGNTSAPELIQEGIYSSSNNWIDLRAGYEGDFVADGRMKQYEQGFGRVDCYQQDTNSGTVTVNIRNRLDLYGVFGSSQAESDWRVENIAAGTIARMKLTTHPNFLWAAGARTILYEWCNTFLGFGGRYSSCCNRPAKLTSDGAVQSVTGAQIHWREWQINLDMSYRIKLFTPYIGVKYSNSRTFLRDFSTPISANHTGYNSFENRDPVGLYVGCAISNGKYFMLNLEGRLIDEEAVTISADIRF